MNRNSSHQSDEGQRTNDNNNEDQIKLDDNTQPSADASNQIDTGSVTVDDNNNRNDRTDYNNTDKNNSSNVNHDANTDYETPTTTDNKSDNTNNSKSDINTQVYKKRFLILLLFCIYSMTNSFQWIEYSTLTNILSSYYQVDNFSINWTSVVYMVAYIPFIMPASWLLELIGLRYSIILGSVGTTIGSAIKCFSVYQDGFTVTMIGQTIVALSQLFVISVPPLLAAVWFPDDQVSTATAFGVFGNQLGIALGFIMPPMFIHETATTAGVESGLRMLFNSVFVFSLLLTLVIVCVFDNKPSKPPGNARLHAQALDQRTNGKQIIDPENVSRLSFWPALRLLSRDKDFVLLVVSYGINVGVFYAISTILNQMVMPSWPELNYLAGAMGLIIVISGMVGSMICGLILDKTHAFKAVTFIIYVFSLLSMALFALVVMLPYSVWPLYLVSGILGFFMTGYLPLGFEFAAEITYPHSENTTAGLLNLSAQVFGIALTFISSKVVDVHGSLTANVFLCSALVVGLVMTACIKAELKRQRAVEFP
ncbi:putative MFS-type transporter C09D4.1 [Fragariocoptes setiger]|uniref:MFS-type transporter C09D4.1 n=1 Tax=Fragariocoptes setiger TaxID=1670756 RepID=A0ABQ7S7F4_9ACAR|nr:putative MFS-type transporter C09D4.1 [Fragariocoptes setiger]